MWCKYFLLVSASLASADDLLPIKEKNKEQLNNAPVIGILSLPLKPYTSLNVSGTSYISSSYVQFIEMAGARVVPIRIDHSYEELVILFSRLNGILFTGGNANMWVNNSALPILTPDYAAKGCFLYDLVKKANDQGQFYPLWGTCLGFELLHVCANNDFGTLQDFNDEPAHATLSNFTSAANSSKIFNELSAGLGQQIMKIMSTLNVSFVSHTFGVSPSAYQKYPKLSEMYKIISTSNDFSGAPYASIIEGNKYPIFGSQFHPEKNLYEWNVAGIPHSYDAVLISTYFSNFFVAQARKNNNTFPQNELNQSLIYNYPPVFVNVNFETVSSFY